MTEFKIEFEQRTALLKELKFLKLDIDHMGFCIYKLIGTKYLLRDSVNFKNPYWFANNRVVSFEIVFNDIPNDIKEHLIFHLDLFKHTNGAWWVGAYPDLGR